MAGPRQKKKSRSSISKVKTGVSGRTKAGRKKVNFLGNETIAKNWDRKLTLAQNYERLGLSVKLNGVSGGVEKRNKTIQDSLKINHTPLHTNTSGVGSYIPGEVRVERDEETGAIIRIVDDDESENKRRKRNPLGDPLNDILDDGSDDEENNENEEKELLRKSANQNAIVKKLEEQAVFEAEELERKKKPRTQSAREEEWVGKLVAKYGDDYNGMFRDRRLNVMQQSEGDLKRRVKKWRAKYGG